MGNLNKVMLIGRLGQEPEKRTTSSGKSVVNVSLATTETWKDNNGQKQEKTEWHRLIFWERVGEIVDQYCQKGSQIYAEGQLQTREWQDKEGVKRYATEVVCRSVQLLDSKPQQQQPQQQQPQQQQADNSQITEDVPF